MNLNHSKIRIVLISLLLLVGQFGVFAHAVEHSFHANEGACEIFLQAEHSPDGPFLAGFTFSAQLENNQASRRLVSVYLASAAANYFSRAPPQFS